MAKVRIVIQANKKQLGVDSEEFRNLITDQQDIPTLGEREQEFSTLAADSEFKPPADGRPCIHHCTADKELNIYYYLVDELEGDDNEELEPFANAFTQFIKDKKLLNGRGAVNATLVLETITKALTDTYTDTVKPAFKGIASDAFQKGSSGWSSFFFSNTKEEYNTKARNYAIAGAVVGIAAFAISFLSPIAGAVIALLALLLIATAIYNKTKANHFNDEIEIAPTTVAA